MTIASIGELTAKQRKVIRAWCMYDWANSGFATSGLTAILPFYFVFLFREQLGESADFFGISFTGSSMWSFGIAFSTALVVITSPVLGVIADRAAIKKTLLLIYTAVGALAVALSFFSAWTAHPWAWLFGMLIISNVGLAGAQVFYNSLLPHLAPNELLDDVSSRGYAYGYIGGGLLLLVHLVVIQLTQDTEIADLMVRVSLVSIAVWWFGWAIWTLKVVPEPPTYTSVSRLGAWEAISVGFTELRRTFKEVRAFKVVVIYLAAYLLFNDAVQTVPAVSGAFAADTLALPLIFIMATILIIQFVAGGGAMFFGWLAARISTKRALTVSLVGWAVIVLFGVAIVPLVPTDHQDFDYRLSHRAESGRYVIEALPELGDSPEDTMWADEVGQLDEGDTLGGEGARRLLEDVGASEYSSYSLSIRGGALDGQTAIGPLHPSTLGAGAIDWWPQIVRDTLWKPLGLQAGYQFLLLGVFVGVVIGGSQALARSLFAQITPETRSGEFFAFFGFMNKVSSVFGPTLYILFTDIYDTRVAITSILVVLLAGIVLLQWVNVVVGAQAAAIEDERRRTISQ